MALTIKTEKPQLLLDKIYKAIDEEKIKTWSYDKEGDFTHVTPDKQWVNKAWLSPDALSNEKELRFKILKPKDKILSDEVNGVYHGRFIEMLLVHFDKDINLVSTIPRSKQ